MSKKSIVGAFYEQILEVEIQATALEKLYPVIAHKPVDKWVKLMNEYST